VIGFFRGHAQLFWVGVYFSIEAVLSFGFLNEVILSGAGCFIAFCSSCLYLRVYFFNTSPAGVIRVIGVGGSFTSVFV